MTALKSRHLLEALYSVNLGIHSVMAVLFHLDYMWQKISKSCAGFRAEGSLVLIVLNCLLHA